MKPIINFIKHWKKHGYKKTIKEWKLNFYKLQTPELITKQRIQGSLAMMLGLLIIFGTFIYRKQYLFLLAIGAGLFLNYISLKQFLAQKEALRRLKEDYVEVGE